LPEWRTDRLRGVSENEQTNPSLPEWQPVAWVTSRRRPNEATSPNAGPESANQTTSTAAGDTTGKKEVAQGDRQTRTRSRWFLFHALNPSGHLHESHRENARAPEFRLCRWHRVERIGRLMARTRSGADACQKSGASIAWTLAAAVPVPLGPH